MRAHVRPRPPGARRDRRERRRRALDHRAQRGAEERDDEHLDGGRGDPVDDALARSRPSGAAGDRRRLSRAAADCVRQRCGASAGSRRREEARGCREIRPRSSAPSDCPATVLGIDRVVLDRGRRGHRSRVREFRCHRVVRSDRSASPRRGSDRCPRFGFCPGPVPGDCGHGWALSRVAPQRRRAARRTSRAFALGDPSVIFSPGAKTACGGAGRRGGCAPDGCRTVHPQLHGASPSRPRFRSSRRADVQPRLLRGEVRHEREAVGTDRRRAGQRTTTAGSRRRWRRVSAAVRARRHRHGH